MARTSSRAVPRMSTKDLHEEPGDDQEKRALVRDSLARVGARMRSCCAALSLLAAALGSAVSGARPLQEVVERTTPGVVHLGVLDASGHERRSGSGFVISEDGRVVTNFHVADAAKRMVAVFGGDRKVDVVGVWAFDAKTDLAVLQLAPGAYRPLALSHEALKQGDAVTVIGSPHGLAGSVSTGIVSAIRQHGAKIAGREYQSWTLQITAPISHGSSGSPVLDEQGDVLGVAVGADDGEALNFAIPASRLAALVATIGPGATPKPLSALQEAERTVRQNLAISAAVIGGGAAIWWFVGFLLRRRNGVGEHTGLDLR